MVDDPELGPRRAQPKIPATRVNMQIRLEFVRGPIARRDGTPNPAPVTATAYGFGNRWISLRSALP